MIKEVTHSETTYGVMPQHEYNPAWAICPFCGKKLEGVNIDFWNRGKKCDCGAYVRFKTATKEK